MNRWPKNLVHWKMGRALYISVPFTWLLNDARKLAQSHTGPVFAGGPAVDLMPEAMSEVANLGRPCPVSPLEMHNPLATFTTRGCPNSCPFCAVPKIEGDLRELKSWSPKPIVCDNNLLAASRKHFDLVVDWLKGLPFVDFNQGLDARLFKPLHARRLAELSGVKVRFAFDHPGVESRVADAISLAREHGLKDFGVYVLIGFRDTQAEALYRLEKVREWGVRPNPMRYQPLNATRKNSHLPPGWTDLEILRTMQYYGRLRWLEHIPFKDYQYHSQGKWADDLFGGVPRGAAGPISKGDDQ